MKLQHKIISTLIVLSFITAPIWGFAATWDIDPAHSDVGFKVKHMMISNVRGAFSDVKGTIEYDPASPSQTTINVTIQAASIDTGVEKRDDHLRSPDFFDVKKFPTLVFKSTKVKNINSDSMQIIGDLTIHGTTKEVVLDVKGPTQEMKDPWGNIRVGASATTKINRSDFGLTWNAALETGGVLVGEQVMINLEVQMVKKAK
jgi:polyisoprenoid-binding protein YceI